MPAAITTRQRAMSQRIWSRFGGGRTLILRKVSNLQNIGLAPPVAGILVRGVTALGAAALSLDAATLRGTLKWGSKFTIAGAAGTFTTTASTTAALNILTSVPFTPVLPSQAADNAAVTITQDYGAFTFRALRTSFSDEDESESAFVVRDWQKYHLLVHADGVAPEVGDLLMDGADTDYIMRCRPVAPAGEASRWIVYTGRSPANG